MEHSGLEKITLTRSACNRALKIIKRLSRKNHDEQIVYLSSHLIMQNGDKDEKQLLRMIGKGKKVEKQQGIEELKQTISYKNASWFWSFDKFQVFASNRRKIENYRKLTFSDERIIDDTELSVCPPEDITKIMKWLKLC